MRCLEAFLGSLLGPALLQCYVLEGWWESKVLPCHCSALSWLYLAKLLFSALLSLKQYRRQGKRVRPAVLLQSD